MKKAEFNFVWIFAILAGIAIMILMIYGAIKTGTTIIYFQDTDLTKQIISHLDPFQAGFAASAKGEI
ncbi:MAG: hypothetical protein NZM44_00220, partial [Candidatus Calescibacterium sp.]|nr:hypothetical protein [Candidatus Calescibacterium sp.]